MDGPMRVGMIGTGAISHKHAQAYRNIGYEVTACTDVNEANGRAFAEKWGGEFVGSYEEVCRHPRVDYVDVCTFPDFRLQPIEICAADREARAGAEADLDQSRDGAAHDRDRGARRASCWAW